MSYYHENVLWQSPDGTWNRGFYTDLGCGGCDDDDETHEWCREFATDSFQWVSTGHATQDAAWRSWDGSNPGSSSIAGPEEVAHLDDMAAQLYESEEAERAARPVRSYGYSYFRGGSGFSRYHGPPRPRKLAGVARERLDARLAWASARLRGYDNSIDSDRDAALASRCGELLKNATPEEKTTYEAMLRDHLAEIEEVKQARARSEEEDRARRSRMGFGPYSGARFYGSDYDVRARQQRQMEREAEVEAWIGRTHEELATLAPPTPPPAPAETATKKTAAKKTTAKTAAKKTTAKKTAAPRPSTTGTRTGTSAGSGAGGGTGAARRKTTAKSTAGSFAAKTHSEPDVTLQPPPAAPPAALSAPAAPSSSTGDDSWGGEVATGRPR